MEWLIIRPYRKSDALEIDNFVNDDGEGRTMYGSMGIRKCEFKEMDYWKPAYIAEVKEGEKTSIVWFTEFTVCGLARTVYIESLFIRDGYRKMGIGKKLIEKAEQEARNFYFDIVLLNVYDYNTNAIDFYTKMGFSKCGERKYHFIRNGEYVTNLQFVKDLWQKK